jgi:hypothetical protein
MKLPLADTRAMAMAIYPQLHEGQVTNEYLRERAILAPRNKEVSLINMMVLKYLPGAQVDSSVRISQRTWKWRTHTLLNSSTLWKSVTCRDV